MSTVLSQISWSNHLAIISKAKSEEERHFYIALCVKENYSAREFSRQIDSGYYERYMLSKEKLLPEPIKGLKESALVKKDNEYIFRAVFSKERTRELIRTARKVCGISCEITIDTIDRHYWNYKVDPKKQDQSWGDSIWTDFSDFDEEALKMCVEIFDDRTANLFAEELPDCDAARFSDGFWYKYTKKGVTKEDSIRVVCDACGLSVDDIIAFGDDYADIGMLKMAGIGVAMGNAIKEVKEIANVVIGTNDEDGIADYLMNY